MTERFNPEMLQLARESRRMTQKDVAAATGLTQAFVSMMEAGEKEPSDERLAKIAEALRYPKEFFAQQERYTGLGISLMFYRKKASALVGHLKWLQAEVNIRRIQVARLLRGVDVAPKYDFYRMDIDEHDGAAEKIAAMLRATWRLPLGPIRNLVATIESAGGVVFKFPFGTTDIDALSQWPDDTPPLFFINAQAPADRARFSLAHELGHMVMHQSATETMEAEANRFASEFLMPASEVGPQLVDIDLKRAAALKPYWRVSMASLIHRAKDLRKISPATYTALCKRLSFLGYRTKEPGPIAPEEPTFIRQILDVYHATYEYTEEHFARLSAVHADEFTARFGQPTRGLRIAN